MAGKEIRRNPHLRLSCARCQRRKIRCDRRFPVCNNCGKASAECVDGDSVRLAATPQHHGGYREVTRLRDRVAWLEAIVRDRLPDVDLHAGPSIYDGERHTGADSDGSPLQTMMQQHDMANGATATFTAPSADQRAHEIGLVSIAASADQQYIGPSSGYFLARLLLSWSPRKGDPLEHDSNTSMVQSTIDSLVDTLTTVSPLPARSVAEIMTQLFFDTIHPQWPVLHERSFRESLDEAFQSEQGTHVTPYAMFQIFMVLAISATIHSSRSRRQVSGASYCLSALKYLDRLNTQGSLPGLQCLLLLLIFAMHSPDMRLNVWYLNYQCIARVVDLGLQRNVTASRGISLQTQETRTRVFWVVMTLDRTVATIMGRPIGLRDEACDLRLPQSELVLEVAQQGHLDPLNNSIEYAVHLFKLTKLNSEIKYVANSVATSYAYPTTADVVQWQRGMLERLDEWETEIPHQGRRDAYIATTCQIRCLTLKMVLLRPSPAISTPPVEMIAACHTAAVRTIRLYEQLYRQDLIIHDWITLHGIVLATITMMYCLRTVKELAQSTGAEDFMGCMSISLSILSACGEHWASAKRSREVLNGLAKSTLSWLKSVKTISGNNNDAAPGLIPEDSGNLPSLPTPLGHPAEMQALESLWPCQNSQDLFSDTTNVDDIMRSLFDGFLPQLDNFDFLQSL